MTGRGFFVVLEGIDGSGTTTQLQRVRDVLVGRGLSVLGTREPTSGPVGTFLRQALERRLADEAGQSTELDWSALALLFAADRVDHVSREIAPALERGQVVLSDRYDLSSIIYQSATSPLGRDAVDWLRTINSHAVRPDLTIVLRIDADVAAARRRARGGSAELYERDELQRRLAAHYLEAETLMPGERLTFVDAEGSQEEVTSAVIARIDALR